MDTLTWNARRTNLTDGKKQTEFHIKHVNFLDSNGQWLELNTSIKDQGSHFFAMGGLFMANLPKFADEVATFNSELRYDILKKERFTAPDMQLEMRALDAAHVAGHIDNIDVGLGGTVECVLYPQAFPAIDADLIYYVHHGRAPRLMKIIRFNGGWVPTDDRGTTDVRFSMNYSEKADVFAEKPIPDNALSKSEKADVFAEKPIPDNALSKIVSAKNTTVKGVIGHYAKSDARRGIGIKRAIMWGYETILPHEDRLKQSIELNYERIDGQHFILTKKHPNSTLRNSAYPLFSDTTTTAYPDPDTETTTCDGEVSRTNQASWAAAQNTVDGTTVSDSATFIYALPNRNNSGRWWNHRGFVGFDLSGESIGTVSAATIDLWIIGKYTGDNDANNYIAVVGATPASNTSLVVGDYDECGDAIDNPTKYSNDLTIDAMTTSAYNSLTFNATGMAAISSAVVNFGIRQGHDIADDQPDIGLSGATGAYYQSADYTDLTRDPKLVVIHSPVFLPKITLIM